MIRYATKWTAVWLVMSVGHASAADWAGFRGPSTRGVSDETGLAVTCYSGYGKTCCVEAKTGELRYSKKLPITEQFAVYASAVAAEGRLYVVTRKSGTFVLPAQPEFRIIAHNQFPSDGTDFNASPAISNKRLFLRSNRFLYCVQQAR